MLLSALFNSGCSRAVKETAYQDYLNKASENTFDPVTEDARVSGFINLLATFDYDTIDSKIDQVYAQDVYFNDTFHTFYSRDDIKNYFLSLTDKAKTTIRFLDVKSHQDEALVRWEMRMEFEVWWKTIDVTSVGITHLRFNDGGLIVLHQDYWDGVEGFYSHLPVVGSLLKGIRGRLGDTGKSKHD